VGDKLTVLEFWLGLPLGIIVLGIVIYWLQKQLRNERSHNIDMDKQFLKTFINLNSNIKSHSETNKEISDKIDDLNFRFDKFIKDKNSND